MLERRRQPPRLIVACVRELPDPSAPTPVPVHPTPPPASALRLPFIPQLPPRLVVSLVVCHRSECVRQQSALLCNQGPDRIRRHLQCFSTVQGANTQWGCPDSSAPGRQAATQVAARHPAASRGLLHRRRGPHHVGAQRGCVLQVAHVDQQLREPAARGDVVLEAGGELGVAQQVGQALAQRLARPRVVAAGVGRRVGGAGLLERDWHGAGGSITQAQQVQQPQHCMPARFCWRCCCCCRRRQCMGHAPSPAHPPT